MTGQVKTGRWQQEGHAEVTQHKVNTEVSEVVLNLVLRMNKPGKCLREEHSRQKLQMV